MLFNKDKLFCDISPTTYKISVQKEIVMRHLRNLKHKKELARKKDAQLLPCVVFEHSSDLIKRAPGVDLTLQKNKVVNIDISCKKINNLIIRPGEEFSFWQTVGKPSKRRGYKAGRVLERSVLKAGTGGGLCNLGNTIHLLVINSPLTVTEFHSHSDALAPDNGKRVPFSAGTSVSYNYIDYRFKNNTDQNVQLVLYVENEHLFAQLRSEHEFPCRYDIFEENHRFVKEGEKYYRKSMIYRNIIEKATGNVIKKELLLDNNSEVMFDYSLIPQDAVENV